MFNFIRWKSGVNNIFIKFGKITCKCKICDIINVTKIINQNKNKNLRAKEDREWRLNSLMMKLITYQKDKSAKRYAQELPLSSVKSPRWLARLARNLFLILENSRFFGDYFFVKSIKHKNCVQNRKISVQLCLYKLR